MSRPSSLSPRARLSAAYDFDVVTDAPKPYAMGPRSMPPTSKSLPPDRADAGREPVKPAVEQTSEPAS